MWDMENNLMKILLKLEKEILLLFKPMSYCVN